MGQMKKLFFLLFFPSPEGMVYTIYFIRNCTSWTNRRVNTLWNFREGGRKEWDKMGRNGMGQSDGGVECRGGRRLGRRRVDCGGVVRFAFEEEGCPWKG